VLGYTGLNSLVERVKNDGPLAQLSTAEVAYVRAWAEGLDLRNAASRYLARDGSPAACRAELESLLERMRGLARLHGRQDLLALLRRDPERIVVKQDQPSLEDFAAGYGDDFFSQAELLEAYEERYGSQPSGIRRRERLRARLLSAVREASSLAPSRQPQRQDLVDVWFDERTAERLEKLGLTTLDHVIQFVAAAGFWWHKQVGGLGPVKAGKVVSFLVGHEGALGALPPSALMRRDAFVANLKPPLAFGIVPIERLAAPADPRLSGALGRFRAPTASLTFEAANDLDAVQAWLDSWPTPATRRAYRSEGERLLLWAMLEQGKALSSLEALDEPAYVAFLARPTEQWIGPRAAQRWSESWRPFTGPLVPSSTRRALAAARSLLSWLAGGGYLSTATWGNSVKP
jgi:hypothetical protein